MLNHLYLKLLLSWYCFGGSVIDGHGMSRQTMLLLKLRIEEVKSYTEKRGRERRVRRGNYVQPCTQLLLLKGDPHI